jgi:PAS domain S-box-containing protein
VHESLRIQLLRRLNVLLALLFTLTAGGVAAWLAGDFIDGQVRRDLLRRAPVGGLVLTADIDAFAQAGASSDLVAPVNAKLRERARQLTALTPSLRAISLLRVPSGDGPAFYVFDFRDASHGQEARPGEMYMPRFGSGALDQLRRDGRAVLAGPFEATDGPRGVAYAFLPAFGQVPAREVRHVVRIEAAEENVRLQSGVIRNLSEAMEQAHSAILILDPAGRIDYSNAVGSRQLGVSRRGLIGRNWREFLDVGAAGVAATEIVGSMAAGVAWQGEWTCRRADGASFPVRGGFSPVRQRDQRVVSYVAVFDDVTEVRLRENELREATEQAREGDRAKGNFLATMSHEVRTPLNGIVGFTGLLLETPLTDSQREQLLAIRASADALVRLTEDILDFARIESGNTRIDPAPCDPRECLEEAIDLHAAAAARKGVDIFHRVAPDVPASIITDQGRLRQVLVNLVGNAVKFTESGEIEVSVSLPREEGNAAGIRLEFAVRDTGPGIAVDDQARLFRPFTQLDASTLRKHGGAGLGLAISRNLVEMLGGQIRVESRPGAGATFAFSIRARVDQPARSLSAPGSRVALVAARGRQREALAALLRSWSVEVVEADSLETLPADRWTTIVRDLGEAEAIRLSGEGAVAGEADGSTVALVPLSLGPGPQAALRERFRGLVTKPVRAKTLFSLVAGKSSSRPAAATRPQFGFEVLVAEDNVVNQRLIRLMLENFGCTVSVVENGRAALTALAAAPRPPDLVLLDMHMPELDGLDVLRALRAGGAGTAARDTWVVALSADVRPEQRAAAGAAGIDEYLVKPVSLRDIEEMLFRFQVARR